eukprot:CAMPEP_0170628576 /NCGR_PEP_ID=MMETSP0224-20130122/32773_1 /TAXON_ID=285029 /ORGANISM="Togula jolla, Strain CCCM 725" /LENGTH=88 /DNA_ID=CAMNT_0010956041 /DNA_START=222 /DNA_END=485 /DNA_ORIENTATION=-
MAFSASRMKLWALASSSREMQQLASTIRKRQIAGPSIASNKSAPSDCFAAARHLSTSAAMSAQAEAPRARQAVPRLPRRSWNLCSRQT